GQAPRFWLGAVERPESDRTIQLRDIYAVTADAIANLFSAAVRQFVSAAILAVFGCAAHRHPNLMNEDDEIVRTRPGSGVKQARAISYTSKDFQLEVLGQLAEVQELTESLGEALQLEIKRSREQNKLLRFDGRTLVAIGAIALSLTEYVLQDAR